MYVEPPQLTVAVYSDQPEARTFSQVCGAAESMGCAPVGRIEVAPADREFELLSDLGVLRETLEPSPARYTQLIAGEITDQLVLRAAFSHQKYGKVIVEYQQKTGSGRHPVGLTVASGPLGIPDSMWTSSQRRSAYSLATWTRSAFEKLAAKPSVKYGAIGVEFSLPTPAQIKNGKPRLTTEIFISSRLLADESREAQLRDIFSGGEVVGWTHGLFCSGWGPYNARRATIDNVAAAGTRVLSVLRAALSAYE